VDKGVGCGMDRSTLQRSPMSAPFGLATCPWRLGSCPKPPMPRRFPSTAYTRHGCCCSLPPTAARAAQAVRRRWPCSVVVGAAGVRPFDRSVRIRVRCPLRGHARRARRTGRRIAPGGADALLVASQPVVDAGAAFAAGALPVAAASRWQVGAQVFELARRSRGHGPSMASPRSCSRSTSPGACAWPTSSPPAWWPRRRRPRRS
jgi:hypothetical protein